MVKPKLIMLQGLPGSGKSTWAKEQAGFVRVNKDELRATFKAESWIWSREGEDRIVKERDWRIIKALRLGYSIISDDTNFGRKHKVRLEQLARKHGADFEIKRFDVPLETCLQRNSARSGDARVPDDVIQRMYQQFVINDPQHYPLSAHSEPAGASVERFDQSTGLNLPPALICDLDGTLSLFKEKGHRGPYDASKADQDDCNLTIKRLLEIYYRFMGYQIIYVSGREYQFRPQAEAFFQTWHVPPGPLHMRATGDHRKDSLVKRELFDQHVRGRYNIDFVLDDRDQVVKMWRDLGLTCFQVAEGAF